MPPTHSVAHSFGVYVLVCTFFAVARPGFTAPFAYVTDQTSPQVDVIDTATDTLVTTIAAANSNRGVGVSPDGTKVYVGPELSGAISVIDGTTNTLITSFASSNGAVSDFAFKSDGSVVYATFDANGTDLVYVIDTATNTVIQSINVPVNPTGIAISPDDSTLYVSHAITTNAITVIDTATNAVTGSIPATLQDGNGALEITPDGNRLYTVHQNNGDVVVIDINTSNVSMIPVAAGPTGIALNPAGTTLYVSHANGIPIEIIDTATATIVGGVAGSTAQGTSGAGIAVTSNNSRVYAARSFQGVEIFGVGGGALLSNIPLFFLTNKIGVAQITSTAPCIDCVELHAAVFDGLCAGAPYTNINQIIAELAAQLTTAAAGQGICGDGLSSCLTEIEVLSGVP